MPKKSGFRFEIKGDKEMIARVRALARTFPIKVLAAMHKEAEVIMTDSRDNYCPVDVGTLKSSGHVPLPKISAGVVKRFEVELVYGGPSAPYAVVQHEEEGYFHPNGKQAKYLERPLKKHAPSFIRNVGKRLK